MKTNELTDAIIRGSCVVCRVDGGMDGSENLAVQITPKGHEFPTTIDLELDDYKVGTPLKEVLKNPAEVEFFINGVCFKLVASYMDGDQVKGEIHETFAENAAGGVGVIQKPFCTFITIPTKQQNDGRVHQYSFDFIITGNASLKDIEKRITKELGLVDGISVVGNPGLQDASWTPGEYGLTPET